MDLYRFYDDNDRLLYIGISLHAAQRASEHRKLKPWWPDVHRMHVEHLDCDRREAERIEREAIIAEAPIHNVTHNVQAASIALAELIWICDECDEPIANGDGYIELTRQERRRHYAETAAYREKYPEEPGLLTVVHLTELPERAQWHVLHRSCDDLPDGAGYWFDVARARSHGELLDWTLHLMEKQWIAKSNWTSFVRHALARNHAAVFA